MEKKTRVGQEWPTGKIKEKEPPSRLVKTKGESTYDPGLANNHIHKICDPGEMNLEMTQYIVTGKVEDLDIEKGSINSMKKFKYLGYHWWCQDQKKQT